MKHVGIIGGNHPSGRYTIVLWGASLAVGLVGFPGAVLIIDDCRLLGWLLFAGLVMGMAMLQFCGFVRVRGEHVEIVRPGMRKSLPRDRLREVRRYKTMVVLDFADDTYVSLRLPLWMPGRRALQDRLCADLESMLKGPASAIPGAGR